MKNLTNTIPLFAFALIIIELSIMVLIIIIHLLWPSRYDDSLLANPLNFLIFTGFLLAISTLVTILAMQQEKLSNERQREVEEKEEREKIRKEEMASYNEERKQRVHSDNYNKALELLKYVKQTGDFNDSETHFPVPEKFHKIGKMIAGQIKIIENPKEWNETTDPNNNNQK